MTKALADSADPMPEPPFEPALEECCGNGCDPCIFDLYAQALQRYRTERQAWLARHPGADIPVR